MENESITAFKDDHVKQLVRRLVQEKGTPVAFEDHGYSWGPTVSTYNWMDIDAREHVANGDCTWTIEEGARLREETYSVFEGTLTDNRDEIGVNVFPARCTCGNYTDMTLRYLGSLGDVLRFVLGVEDGGIEL